MNIHRHERFMMLLICLCWMMSCRNFDRFDCFAQTDGCNPINDNDDPGGMYTDISAAGTPSIDNMLAGTLGGESAGILSGEWAGETMVQPVAEDQRLPEDMAPDMEVNWDPDSGIDMAMRIDMGIGVNLDPTEWCEHYAVTHEQINGIWFAWTCIHGAESIYQVMTHELFTTVHVL